MAERRRMRTTRRRFVLGGTAAAGSVLAGCVSGTEREDEGDGDGTETDGSETETEEATETVDGTETAEEAEEATETEESAVPYTVEMEPVGEVTFEAIPETWFPYTGDYADMGVALGQGDGLLAVGIRERFASHFYDELPGVSVDEDDFVQLWQGETDKEVFYELGADVHLIDPNFMIERIQWERDDIDEISGNVAPFCGNTIFSGSYPWHDDYTQYTLYEAFEKVAEVFRERERYEAFEQLHDEVLSDVKSRLPDEAPGVAVLYPMSDPPETFLPYVVDSGTSFEQWRNLEVEDALAKSDVKDFHETRGEIDYETLLDVDPEVIAVRQYGEVTEEDFEEEIVSHMRDDPLGSSLQAVRNDRVIRGGAPYQGPIVHLFQLEQAAQDLYPDVFTEDELFDRQRVADIVTGDF